MDWEEQCGSVALTGWMGAGWGRRQGVADRFLAPGPYVQLFHHWALEKELDCSSWHSVGRVCPCEEEVELKVKALDLPVGLCSYTTW